MRRLSTLILTIGALALAACGSSSGGGSSTGTGSSSSSSGSAASSSSSAASTPAPSSPIPKGALEIAANSAGQLMFDKSTLTAPSSRVTIAFTNLSPLDHNLTVEDPATKKILGHTETFQGTTKLLNLDLKPGTYKYFCSVPGHRMAGMEGTLTVK
jgi:plastocyanin